MATVAQGGESGDSDIDANDGRGRVNGLFDFALVLDRHKPFAAVARYGDVLRCAEHVPAVAIANPAQLGQEDSGIALIELVALRVAEAVRLAFFLEAREVGAFGKEVGVGSFQILEGCLLYTSRCV